MNTNTSQQETAREAMNSNSLPEVQEGVMQVAMGILVVTAAIVGIWGLVSLFAGISMEGGVLDMVNGWMNAVTGS